MRVQFKGEVNVGIVSGVYRDESGRTKQRVDDSERYKKGTKESREWSMDDTRQKKIFWWVGGGESVRGATWEELRNATECLVEADECLTFWMPITKPKYSAHVGDRTIICDVEEDADATTNLWSRIQKAEV